MDLDLPPELLCQPLPLVSFVGLDSQSPVWSRFSHPSGSERERLRITSSDDLQWPPMKPKRNTYEWFIPKGILKKNWMSKHLYQLPAVVAIFMELDWNETNFNEKKMECASRVQTVRSTLAGRSTKLAVVLLQKETSLPTSEDVLASERASSLCSACELSNRSLFVLPVFHENLDGYVHRLENAFYDLAQNYYHQEIRSVKSHRDFLNKTTHLYLFVRHQFKAGFLNELKSDFHAAYKFYGQAYSLLMEVRATDTNIMEVKTVSGFISYKICKLAFQLNLPRDAISQFRKHMDIFQQKVGSDELAFEHKGWQSKQCQFFAQIFEEAINIGLPAIQTQHPGLYYQQAALYAIARRELAEEQGLDSQSYPSPDPLENLKTMEFFGQRPWRPENVSLEPPDHSLEKAGIQALLHVEKTQIDHHNEAIKLLEKAIAQFRTFKSPRSECHLVVTMAEELKSAQKYREALSLLQTVMVQYRKEKWRSLLDAVLSLGLKCSFLLCDAAEYLRLGLDLCSTKSEIGLDDKQRVMTNLMGLFEGKIPAAEPGLTSKRERAAVGEATEKWKQILQKDNKLAKNPLKVEIERDSCCLEFSCTFEAQECKANEKIALKVLLYNGTCSAVPISRLQVQTASEEEYNIEWKGEESLQANRTWLQMFQFIPKAKDVGNMIGVKSLSACIGHPGQFEAMLSCNIEQKMDLQKKQFFLPQETLEVVGIDATDGGGNEAVALHDHVEVNQRDPLMEVTLNWKGPILIGEVFEIIIKLKNLEPDHDAKNINIRASLMDAADPIISDTTRFSFDKAKLLETPLTPATPVNEDFNFTAISKPTFLEVGKMSKNSQTEEQRTLYLQASTIGPRGLNIEVTYDVAEPQGGLNCSCVVSKTLELDSIEPFVLETNFNSLRFTTINEVYTDEVFFLMPKIKSVSPHAMEILDSFVELRSPLQLDSPVTSQLKGLPFYPSTVAEECYPCIVQHQDLLSKLDVQDLTVGKYVIKWCREGKGQAVNESIFDFPTVKVQLSGLTATVKLPAFGVVRTPLTLTYVLTNHTEKVQEYSLEVETSESFMLSGNKQVHFKVLPHRDYNLSYALYPLIAGDKVPLPIMKLASTRIGSQPQDVNDILNRMLPKSLAVLPKAREAEQKLKDAAKKPADLGPLELQESVIMQEEPFKIKSKVKAY